MSAFSVGQNFFNTLLDYSDKNTDNDNQAIQQAYQLQKRLDNIWANNNKPVLMHSKKFSGIVNNDGNSEPLGGVIDWNECGSRNLQNCENGCPDEFSFWGFTKDTPVPNTIKPVDESEIVEKFTNESEDTKEKFTIDNKENLDGNTTRIIFWVLLPIGILIFLLLIFGFKIYNHPSLHN